MVRKKHCEKHYRFVATCPDCQAENESQPNDDNNRRYYPDVKEKSDINKNSTEKGPEIPHLGNPNSSNSDTNDSRRFRYIRDSSPDKKRKIMIAGIVGGIIVLVLVLYVIPLWFANLNLKNQMYETKSGLDYWKLLTLNYWSTSFIINKIGLIGAILGCLIFSIPPERNIIAILGQQFNWGRPTMKKTLLIWWTGGLVFFFLVGQAIENGYFALTMTMISEGHILVSFGTYFNALEAIFNPVNLNPVDLFVYSNVTRPIIIYCLVLIIIRFGIKIVHDLLVEKNEIKPVAFGFYIVSIFFFMSLTKRPMIAQNAIHLIRVWSIFLGFLLCLGIGIAIHLYANRQEKMGYTEFPREINKSAIIAAVALIFIILIPVFISIPKSINSEVDQDAYKEYIWDVQLNKEIEWTRSAAGIQMGDIKLFETKEITEYPNNVISSDAEILNVIRQYDKQITSNQLFKSIKSSREDMGDSDIIYISEGPGAGEYWVAPKTLPADLITQSNVNQHTELYDYVNGFIAIDTSTGEQVDPEDYESIFGVSSDTPIFFGEKADTTYTDTNADTFSFYEAYEDDILLYTSWRDNKTITYDSDPDGTLNGLQGFLYTFNMGLYSDAVAPGEKSFLINRNIRTRVESVLLPGMVLDSDPYLVFNSEEGEIFYALSVYTDMKIGAYANSHLYRFLGTVLVDVNNGELSWYRSPQNTGVLRNNDIFASLWEIYTDEDLFNWEESMPGWLFNQIRYPEDLWERQLAVDYQYHITDPTIWFGGHDVYKAVEDTDVYYIESDLSEGIEFVGTNFVEYDATGTEILAGVYMIRHGENFGETVFYYTRGETDHDLIGPETAEDLLTNLAARDYPSISDTRIGNTILYPIADSLYYYIPIYSQSSDSGLENLIITGLVNAFDKTTYLGDSLVIAYGKLLEDQHLIPTNTTTNATTAIEMTVTSFEEIDYDEDIPAEIVFLLEYPEGNNTTGLNLTMNMTIYSSVEMEISLYGTEIEGIQFNSTFNDGYNYTIKEWYGDNALYPSDIQGFTLKVNPKGGMNLTILSMTYTIDLINMDTGEIYSSETYILTYRNY